MCLCEREERCLPLKEADRIRLAGGSVHTSNPLQRCRVHLQPGWATWLWWRLTFAPKVFSPRDPSTCGLRYDGSDALTCGMFWQCWSALRSVANGRWMRSLRPCVPLRFASLAMFGRTRVPAASTLSRLFAALPAEPVEALRALVLDGLLARPLSSEEHAAGRGDRQGHRWHVVESDGTREAARQRALPQTPDRPAPHGCVCPLCAPGSIGEGVRTRTPVLQMQTPQWVASVGNPGNGHAREDLR